jgi:hypothetical protein
MFRAGNGQSLTMVAIVLIVVLLTLAGATYGIFTRRGSGIGQHPRGGDHVDSPGVGEGKSPMTGREGDSEGTFDSRGSR